MELLSNKVPTDQLLSAAWNQPSKEVENVITSVGISLSAGDLTQLKQAIAEYAMAGQFMVDTGIAAAYQLDPPALMGLPDAYVQGALVRFKATNVNSAAPTATLGGFAALNIIDDVGGSNIAAGVIQTSGDVTLRYDSAAGGKWILANLAVAAYPAGHCQGFFHDHKAPSNVEDVGFNVGSARDNTNTVNIDYTGAEVVKQIDATWAEGNNQGGVNATDYPYTWGDCPFTFVISKADGTCDFGYDLDPTGANLLADAASNDYIYAKLIGAVAIATDANPWPFYHDVNDLNRFYMNTPYKDFTDSSIPSTGEQVIVLKRVPALCRSVVYLERETAVSAVYTSISSGNVSVVGVPSSNHRHLASITGSTEIHGIAVSIQTDASQQIKYQTTNTNGNITIRIDHFEVNRNLPDQ